jgi:hypothetical protein
MIKPSLALNAGLKEEDKDSSFTETEEKRCKAYRSKKLECEKRKFNYYYLKDQGLSTAFCDDPPRRRFLCYWPLLKLLLQHRTKKSN